MSRHVTPPTLDDVMQVVDRRRRDRQRTRAAAGSALAIAGLSVTGIVAVTLRSHDQSVLGTPGGATPSTAPSAAPSSVAVGPPSASAVAPPSVAATGTEASSAFGVSRAEAYARFEQVGYSADDAVLIAVRWADALDVSGSIRDSDAARFAVGAALAAGTSAEEFFAPEGLNISLTPAAALDYLESTGYTEADILLLAEEWGIDQESATVRAAIEDKTVGALPRVDPAGAGTAGLVFWDAGYTGNDAIALAEAWGLPGDPAEHKGEIGQLVADFGALDRSPMAETAAADGMSDAELADVFLAAGYTEVEAEVLATRLGLDAAAAAAWAGRELLVVGALPWVDPPVN